MSRVKCLHECQKSSYGDGNLRRLSPSDFDEEHHVDQQPSLYARVGGYDVVHHMAGIALKRAITSDTIGGFWTHITEASLKEELANFVDFLCHIWGGPVAYRGRDMVTAHRGMGVKDEDWDALFVIIRDCNREFGVPQELADEIEQSLQRLKPTIVGSPTFRDVLIEHPDMDIEQGMRGVGVHWPSRRTPAPSDAHE